MRLDLAALPNGIRGIANDQPVPLPTPLVGVYFLVQDGAIVYIGQSIDIRLRLLSQGNRHQFDSVFYLPCDAADLNDLEKSLILALEPAQNGSHRKQRKVAGWRQWAVDTLER